MPPTRKPILNTERPIRRRDCPTDFPGRHAQVKNLGDEQIPTIIVVTHQVFHMRCQIHGVEATITQELDRPVPHVEKVLRVGPAVIMEVDHHHVGHVGRLR
jgi:hypothetical protein